MRIRVSLPGEDVEFLDQDAKTHGYPSRAAVVYRAVRLFRASELGSDYAAAWDEWDESGDGRLWETAIEDGLSGDL